MITVAINGFGRIGRSFLRNLLVDAHAAQKIRIGALNIGPAHPDSVAHMFTYDTLMGTYPGVVHVEGTTLIIDTHRIPLVAEKDPALLPWKELGIDWVVEASGCFTHKEGANKHLQAGAQRVLITAPAHGDDVSIIPGVNDDAYDAARHNVVSLGSCTTNAFAPTLKILDEAFGIEYGCMTTVHAYTNTQVLLDVEGEDLRRSRAAALNIIPTGTGAMGMIAKVLPHLADRVEALSLRVPVAKVSLLDLTFTSSALVTVAAINSAFAHAAQNSMRGILGITHEALVSSDFSGDARSVIIDGKLTTICGSHMGKVFGWYDNEWAYSARLKDFLVSVA